MANPKHLDILKQRVDAWNQWKKEHPETLPDLSEASLIGANFSAAKLGMANLRRADLRAVNLSGADLSFADLSGAHLHGADLSTVDLSGANLSEVKLFGSNLSEADLSTAEGLTQEQINDAWGDKDTKLPKGLNKPAQWLRKGATH